jgi:hypothetical protein
LSESPPVGDPRLISLIRRWLKAGVLEDGAVHPSEQGTPQGGSISVLLSNLYLHYVLDLWFERVVKGRLRGEARLVRYIDDFVICFQYRSDAIRVQEGGGFEPSVPLYILTVSDPLLVGPVTVPFAKRKSPIRDRVPSVRRLLPPPSVPGHRLGALRWRVTGVA